MPRVPSIIRAQGASSKPQAIASKGPALAQQQIADRQTNAIQRAALDATAVARALPFGDGNLIKDVVFTAGVATVINHGLGKPYAGWLLLRPRGNITSVLENNQASNLNSKQVTLASQGSGTADVWVYR